MYLLRYLPEHLANAGDYRRLVELLTASCLWMDRKAEIFSSDSSFQDDLDLALSFLKDPLANREDVLSIVRLSAAREVVSRRAGTVADDELSLLAWIGLTERAVGLAELRLDPERVCDGLMVIYRVWNQESQDGIDLLTRVQFLLGLVQSERGRVYVAAALASEYWKCKDLEASDRNLQIALDALQDMPASRLETTWAKQVLARVLGQIRGREEAIQMLDRIGDPFWRLLAFADVVLHAPDLVSSRNLSLCRELIAGLEDATRRWYATHRLIHSLVRLGENAEAKELFKFLKALQRPPSANSQTGQAEIWEEASRVELGDLSTAPRLLLENSNHTELVRFVVDSMVRTERADLVESALERVEDSADARSLRRRLILSLFQSGLHAQARQRARRYEPEADEECGTPREKPLDLVRHAFKRSSTNSNGVENRRVRRKVLCEMVGSEAAKLETSDLLDLEDSAFLKEIDQATQPLATVDQMEIRIHLGVEYGRIGLRHRATEILGEIFELQQWWRMDGASRSVRSSKLAEALAESGVFLMAFESLAVSRQSDATKSFLKRVLHWWPYFESVAPGLGNQAAQEATRILAWIESDYLRAHEALLGPVDLVTQYRGTWCSKSESKLTQERPKSSSESDCASC